MTVPVTLYEYAATMVYVVDGDTADLIIDLGFGVTKTERVRFMGINAPEKGDEPGYTDAKAYVNALFARLKYGISSLFIRTVKDKYDNWGRYLANLYEVTDDGNVVDISADMLNAGLAIPYERK